MRVERSTWLVWVCVLALAVGSGGRAANLVGLWKLEENATTQTVVDSSGNGLTGTYASGVGAAIGGAPGSGLGADFRGTNHLISLGTQASLYNRPNNFSVEAWVNAEQLSGSLRVIANQNWALAVDNGGVMFTTFGVKDYRGTAGQITAGKWTHIAAVMDTNNDVQFYVNGNAAGLDTWTLPGNTGATPTFIGGRSGSYFFPGVIDEVAVYDGELTQAEVQAHYASGVPTAKAPVFRYDYDSSAPLPAIPDDSAAGNGATAQAGAAYSSLTPSLADAPRRLGTGDSSLATSLGGATTDAINLVNNAKVAAAGGFTMEDWIYRTSDTNASGGTVEKIIDFGGVYRLYVDPDFDPTGDNDAVRFNYNGGTAIVPVGEWHHVAAVFDAQGNTVDGSGNLAGVTRFYVDGQQVGSDQGTTLSGFNDASYLQTRGIGVGRHPVGGEWFQGLHYDSRVSLGVHAPGEFGLSSQPDVFHYKYESAETSLSFIPDDSSAVRNATRSANGFATSRPGMYTMLDGHDGGDLSLDTSGGGARTQEINLVDTFRIAQAGGFTMCTWAQRTADTNGGRFEKIMDIGGVYRFQLDPDSDATGSNDLVRANYNGATAVMPLGEWHHLAVVFDTLGNLPNASGDLTGVTRFFFDGVQLGGDGTVTLTDSFFNYYASARGVGLGRHPTGGGEEFQGLLYNTRLLWGPRSGEQLQLVPEPTSLALLGIGGLAALIRRRRRA